MRRFALRVAAAFVVFASAARAAPPDAPTPEDEALAEELFRTAKREMSEGAYASACPKLAESYRLDPGGGTLLTLALCRESAGLTASAWADFNAAIALAKHDGRVDRETIAREHADALEPRLRRLRVRVAPPAAAGLVIRRDGVALAPASWNVAAPVDPGEHVVEASAPGRVAFHVSVVIDREGSSVDVDVPFLAPVAASAPLVTVPPEPAPRAPTPARWVSYASAGLALVAAGAGTFFAIDARAKRDDANARCPAASCADAGAVDLSRQAGERADLATGSFVAAGVLAAAAVVIFVVSPHTNTTR